MKNVIFSIILVITSSLLSTASLAAGAPAHNLLKESCDMKTQCLKHWNKYTILSLRDADYRIHKNDLVDYMGQWWIVTEKTIHYYKTIPFVRETPKVSTSFTLKNATGEYRTTRYSKLKRASARLITRQ